MTSHRPPPPDQHQRDRAIDPSRSILVQAPAGSGKTTLLTERFLRLLAEVDDPSQVVAITFTNAAAAEMRNRVLDELRAPDPTPAALRALHRAQALDWKLLDLPAQLRISTIDSFCRDLALQQPLLSGLGGGLGIAEQPDDLYRRAARTTLRKIDPPGAPLSSAIAALLRWRDNNWQEMEDLLVKMLAQRDRWMHGFVLDRAPDWAALRTRLELPFTNAIRQGLTRVSQMLHQAPAACHEILSLARFAVTQENGEQHRGLAELPEIPIGPFHGSEIGSALEAHLLVANLLLTNGGTLRKAVDKNLGFPSGRKQEKARLLALIASLRDNPAFEPTLASLRTLPDARYTDDEWLIVQACFTVLSSAAAELKVVFAEAGAVDFTEVSQLAQAVLRGPDGQPTDAALALADGIRHLLVDEFQDTSRRQHQLLASLIAAWASPDGRTAFMVGDPMQSIYFFRDADAELFPRVQKLGLELPDADPFLLEFVPLQANFRTTPALVSRLNQDFAAIFAENDGSGIQFSAAIPAREPDASPAPSFTLHLNFYVQAARNKTHIDQLADEKAASIAAQTDEIVTLIQTHTASIQAAQQKQEKYRVAILGRTRRALAPIASALRSERIPFRAVDLENLNDRPEILDTLALARALHNPLDRTAWLGVLRAPWCGLALADLHTLTSADDPALLARPIPDLLAERLHLLSPEAQPAVRRVLAAFTAAPALRAAEPAASLATWLQQVWLSLGGAACVDSTALANLDLLWSCLDKLPAGEPDLLGPTLDAALSKLTALPAPETSSECGVQLMTIHKSKGLEFEVVLVPDLQAGAGKGDRKLLSWLERGLAEPDESGDITEFLIAPVQSKGADRGEAKKWVDAVYRERESQEMRRILYVAATRAREELHFFARPGVRMDKDGNYVLKTPTGSLLATAWPALQAETEAQFAAWSAAFSAAEEAKKQQPQIDIPAIAASADTNLLVMPTPAKPTTLRRLPPDYQPAKLPDHSPDQPIMMGFPSLRLPFGARVGNHEPQSAAFAETVSQATLYTRHEGGQHSRALGTAVHTLLEDLARLRLTHDWPAARAVLQRLEPRIASAIRSHGIDPSQAAAIAAQALHHVHNAANDPTAQWILAPHPGAASEASWTGVLQGKLRTVRVDRIFQAGPTPLAEGQDYWWIVDYKTAHADALDPATALAALRPQFAPQLEAYAQVLRKLNGADQKIRAALYYPRMSLLDWWEL